MNINQKIRALAMALLDDDHGISEKAYNQLLDLLDDYGITDIPERVESCEGRFFIEEPEGEWVDSYV